MDRTRAREDDKWMLKRIVALLYAFAALAERASTRHSLLRASVLWILRSAETIAREFVMDMAMENGVSLTPAVLLIPALHGGDSSSDAIRLASSFRALAILLDQMAYGNPGRLEMRIAKLCIKLTACAAGLSGGTQVGRRQPGLAPPGFVIARCDSS